VEQLPHGADTVSFACCSAFLGICRFATRIVEVDLQPLIIDPCRSSGSIDIEPRSRRFGQTGHGTGRDCWSGRIRGSTHELRKIVRSGADEIAGGSIATDKSFGPGDV